MSAFSAQGLANTAWAFATLGQLEEKLFAALASQAELRVSEFNDQELANTAWACATLGHSPWQDLAPQPKQSRRPMAGK